MNDYQAQYRIASVQSASAVQLVCMLYDRLVADLRRAIEAIESKDIEARSGEIKHALLILQHLEGSLDRQRGGEAAVNLARFYQVARSRIVEGHAKVDPAIFHEQIALFQDVRSAWEQVDPARGEAPLGTVIPTMQMDLCDAPTSGLSCSG